MVSVFLSSLQSSVCFTLWKTTKIHPNLKVKDDTKSSSFKHQRSGRSIMGNLYMARTKKKKITTKVPKINHLLKNVTQAHPTVTDEDQSGFVFINSLSELVQRDTCGTNSTQVTPAADEGRRTCRSSQSTRGLHIHSIPHHRHLIPHPHLLLERFAVTSECWLTKDLT